MAVFLFMPFLSSALTAHQNLPFLIRISDAETGRGVPLVELELENGLKLVSDNDGNIALNSPDLFGHRARLRICGQGYSTGKTDFWGQESISAVIEPGQTMQVKLQRKFAAQRLYRITGAARFNHTLLAGKTPSFLPGARLWGKVIGQDSLICLPWQNRLWHFYGDTLSLSSFNFSASCATAPMPDSGKYDPEIGVPLEYIVDADGFAAKMIETGKKGFTWIEYVLPVKLARHETLIAKYVQHATLDLVEEAGFAIFNRNKGKFSIVKRWQGNTPHKCTHPYPVALAGKEGYLLFPWRICGTSINEIMSEDQHLTFTCLEPATPGSRQQTINFAHKAFRVRRNANGQVIYHWQKAGVPADSQVEKKMLHDGLLKPSELLFAPVSLDDGQRIFSFNGSIVYSHFKKRWIMINQGHKAGDIVYAEADTPTGPWAFARQISGLDNYNLYNPILHPWFFKENGRIVFFEGTYTNYFSASPGKTPEVDYNQVMYKLDTEQEQMLMPIAIYRVNEGQNPARLRSGAEISRLNLWPQVESLDFFAFSEHATHQDLIRPVDKIGRGFPFKLLKLQPESAWGKKLLNLSSEHFHLEKMSFGENSTGLCFKIPGTAQTWSGQIEPRHWQ